MALLLHYTGQDYISRGLLNTELTPGSTSAIVGGCKTGKGFAFDSTANSVMPINAGFQRPDSVSISCWAKASNSTGLKTIFSSGITNVYALFHQYGRWVVRIQDSRISIVLFRIDGTYYDRGFNVAVTEWNHITAIFTPTRIALFVNGSLVSEQTVSGDFRPDWLPILGGLQNTTGYIGNIFNGQICNFKLYNHVLSQKEINEDYKSLMLHYKLDKPITTQVFDHSGFNRHITNLTSNTVTLDSNSQVYSASLKNDGTQSLAGTSDLTDLNGLDEGSFSFRAFLTVNNLSDQYVIYNMTDLIGGNGILFNFRNSVVIAYFYGTRIQFNYSPTVDAWHHVVLVKTSSQIKVYVDNVNIYTVSSATSSTNFSNITSISSVPNGLLGINNGNVQDIRFYAKALTQADVIELYQTRQEIDNLANGYCYELVEGQSEVEMKANGQLYCNEVIENDDGTFSINQNKTIKTKEIKEI